LFPHPASIVAMIRTATRQPSGLRRVNIPIFLTIITLLFRSIGAAECSNAKDQSQGAEATDDHRLQGKSSFRMGAPPPVPGKPGTTPAKAAAVAASAVSYGDEDVALFVGLAVGTGARHSGTVMVLESNVTEAVCARARPSKLAPVCSSMSVDARIFPMNVVYVPIVAELTSRHHVLHGSPSVIDEWDDVMSVAADLKI